MPYDNVIIFGAGASHDAGIPLLNNFVDTMWGYAVRGCSPQGAILSEDRKLLTMADDIRVGLEKYNSRANFNLRNLEDVLSLLYFESLRGGDAKVGYEIWKKAITRTIELSTNEPYSERPELSFGKSNTFYHRFWDVLLGTELHKRPPALITFNYDLVFERTLSDRFAHLAPSELPYPVRAPVKPAQSSCRIRYFLDRYDFVIKPKQCIYDLPVPNTSPARRDTVPGFRPGFDFKCDADIEVPYLKLHGSLNWSSPTTAKRTEQGGVHQTPVSFPTQAVDNPLILPPVFNKMNSEIVEPVWQGALEILREAKHIILVGYSLPKTDIYMQYFLKSAVGPNRHLQWIKVFDPTLFQNDAANEEMRARYQDCFSPQFKERIVFRPESVSGVTGSVKEQRPGTFYHFIRTLEDKAKELLF